MQTGTEVFACAPRIPQEGEICWIHLVSPDEAELLMVLKDTLALHPLAIEDALHFGQRPKVDLYQNWARPHALVSFYTLTDKLDTVELSLLVGDNFFVSLTRQEIPWLDELYRRASAGGITFATPTDLLYRVLDGCVDTFTMHMDGLEERLDRMERRVFRHPEQEIASTVFQLKRRLHELRKISLDAQTTVSTMKSETFPFIDSHYEVYFHDVGDHMARVLDSIELVRDRLSSVLDFQAVQRAAKMNDVMKTLAIISTIFLPLSFIVGLYGMNFHNMPELSWHYGYLYVWILLVSVASFFIVYFKWKRWW